MQESNLPGHQSKTAHETVPTQFAKETSPILDV